MQAKHGQASADLTVAAILDPESIAGLAYSVMGPLEPDTGEGCQHGVCESDDDCICQDPLSCGCLVDDCEC